MGRLPNPARLVINADDFGLTAGVNRAVAELAGGGALRSATLMASGTAFDHAVSMVRATPGLHVGCHVVLVDGDACAPPERIPSLIDGNGSLRTSLAAFLFDLQTGRIAEREIEEEACA